MKKIIILTLLGYALCAPTKEGIALDNVAVRPLPYHAFGHPEQVPVSNMYHTPFHPKLTVHEDYGTDHFHPHDQGHFEEPYQPASLLPSGTPIHHNPPSHLAINGLNLADRYPVTKPDSTDEIEALGGNKCRCGGFYQNQVPYWNHHVSYGSQRSYGYQISPPYWNQYVPRQYYGNPYEDPNDEETVTYEHEDNNCDCSRFYDRDYAVPFGPLPPVHPEYYNPYNPYAQPVVPKKLHAPQLPANVFQLDINARTNAFLEFFQNIFGRPPPPCPTIPPTAPPTAPPKEDEPPVTEATPVEVSSPSEPEPPKEDEPPATETTPVEVSSPSEPEPPKEDESPATEAISPSDSEPPKEDEAPPKQNETPATEATPVEETPEPPKEDTVPPTEAAPVEEGSPSDLPEATTMENIVDETTLVPSKEEATTSAVTEATAAQNDEVKVPPEELFQDETAGSPSYVTSSEEPVVTTSSQDEATMENSVTEEVKTELTTVNNVATTLNNDVVETATDVTTSEEAVVTTTSSSVEATTALNSTESTTEVNIDSTTIIEETTKLPDVETTTMPSNEMSTEITTDSAAEYITTKVYDEGVVVIY